MFCKNWVISSPLYPFRGNWGVWCKKEATPLFASIELNILSHSKMHLCVLWLVLLDIPQSNLMLNAKYEFLIGVLFNLPQTGKSGAIFLLAPNLSIHIFCVLHKVGVQYCGSSQDQKKVVSKKILNRKKKHTKTTQTVDYSFLIVLSLLLSLDWEQWMIIKRIRV